MGAPVVPVDANGRAFEEGHPLAVSQPLDLMTDGGDGPNRRLMVETGQAGFFGGREFRTFFEFDASVVIRATVPVNTILMGLDFGLIQGEARIETVVGGTPGGAFATPLPIFGRNNMSDRPLPLYLPQVTLDAGGTHTGGVVLDIQQRAMQTLQAVSALVKAMIGAWALGCIISASPPQEQPSGSSRPGGKNYHNPTLGDDHG